MKTYEKPRIVQQSLLTNKAIANTCWGYHSGGSPTWWYDDNGTEHGFVDFHIHEGQKCGQLDQMVTIAWYQNRDALDDPLGSEYHYLVVKDQAVVTDSGNTVYPWNTCYDYLIRSGGSAGNPFSGENNLILDDDSMV